MNVNILLFSRFLTDQLWNHLLDIYQNFNFSHTLWFLVIGSTIQFQILFLINPKLGWIFLQKREKKNRWKKWNHWMDFVQMGNCSLPLTSLGVMCWSWWKNSRSMPSGIRSKFPNLVLKCALEFGSDPTHFLASYKWLGTCHSFMLINVVQFPFRLCSFPPNLLSVVWIASGHKFKYLTIEIVDGCAYLILVWSYHGS